MFISTVVSGAMMSAYFPVLSQVAGDTQQAKRVAHDFATLMVWMGLPIAALGWACGRHVNDLLFGAQFAAAGPYFEWLCLVVALTFTNIGLGTPLLAWGHQKLHLKIIATSALASLVLNALLVPRYGGWGAVAALLMAETMSLGLLAIARRRLELGRIALLPLLAPPLSVLARGRSRHRLPAGLGAPILVAGGRDRRGIAGRLPAAVRAAHRQGGVGPGKTSALDPTVCAACHCMGQSPGGRCDGGLATVWLLMPETRPSGVATRRRHRRPPWASFGAGCRSTSG